MVVLKCAKGLSLICAQAYTHHCMLVVAVVVVAGVVVTQDSFDQRASVHALLHYYSLSVNRGPL